MRWMSHAKRPVLAPGLPNAVACPVVRIVRLNETVHAGPEPSLRVLRQPSGAPKRVLVDPLAWGDAAHATEHEAQHGHEVGHVGQLVHDVDCLLNICMHSCQCNHDGVHWQLHSSLHRLSPLFAAGC